MTPYILVFFGLLAGGVVTWLVMKGKLALAEGKGRAIGDVERTSLSEQLKAAAQELTGTKTRLADAEGKAQQLQTGMADLRETSGRLTADVAGKEKQLGELKAAHELLSTERDSLLHSQAGFKATIAER